jgi:hypothetical protein
MNLRQPELGAVLQVKFHPGRRRPQHAHHHVLAVGVGTEHRVRVGVLATHQGVQFLIHHRHAASSNRLMPATGIATQSGRLSSSYCSS